MHMVSMNNLKKKIMLVHCASFRFDEVFFSPSPAGLRQGTKVNHFFELPELSNQSLLQVFQYLKK
jgi:hypothetical protein